MAKLGGGTHLRHRIEVWDLPTRLFHWSLVAAVTVALYTGFIALHSWLPLHRWAGYAITALIVFRFVWAAYGSELSRLTSFTYAPAEIAGHIKGLALGRPRHYLGHNPTGAAMIFAVAIVLMALVATGLLAEGGEEKLGPLAGVTSYAIGSRAKAVHGVLVYVLIGLIGGHVLGVIVETRLSGENLIATMITGNKEIEPGIQPPVLHPPHWRAAALAWAGIVAAIAMPLFVLGKLPPYGMPAYVPNGAHARECGACHWAYHPALLPSASWAAVLTTLDDHFGEDASLPAARVAEIAAFFSIYSAEHWDNEIGNRFRRAAADEPRRITRLPEWVRRHTELPDSLFARASVGAKGNCLACHRDADTGRFDDAEITIPKE